MVSPKRTLASVVDDERGRGAFTPADAVDLALDVCDALSAAHAEGVVHGNLGPSLRVARSGAIDLFSRSDEDAPAFLAPEQRESGRVVDARADVFAVGALLGWMLGAANRAPRALLAAVEACLAPDPAARPQDIDDLAERLAAFASWPPVRFGRLAERREARKMRRIALARDDRKEARLALERLDDAALRRESGAVSVVAPAPRPVARPMRRTSPSLRPVELELAAELAEPPPRTRAAWRRAGSLAATSLVAGALAFSAMNVSSAPRPAPAAPAPAPRATVVTVTPAQLPDAPIPTLSVTSLPDARPSATHRRVSRVVQ